MYTVCMSVFSGQDRRFMCSVSGVGYTNPFLPERIAHESAALGREFVDAGPVWSASVSDPDATRPNVISIYKKLNSSIEGFRERIDKAAECNEEDLRIYEESVH